MIKRLLSWFVVLIMTAVSGAVLLKSTPAFAFPLRGSGAGIGISCGFSGQGYVDGCSGAPAGSMQLPSILSGYPVRPPWNVAGVDYYTGIPAGTSLADPATASLPTGATYNTNYARPNTTITAALVLNTPGGTITALDFSLHGGVEVVHIGGNWTVQNSNFVVGATNVTTCLTKETGTNPDICATAIFSAPGTAGNITVLNSTINGNSVAPTAQHGATMDISNAGTFTFKYNYVFNTGGDAVDMYGGPMVEDIRYNLFKNISITQVHGDTLQNLFSNVTAATVGFNTVYDAVAGAGGSGNGLLGIGPSEGSGTDNACSSACNITNAIMENNTVIGLAACGDPVGSCNWTIQFYVDTPSNTPAPIASNITYKDNYLDSTGPLSWTGFWLLPLGGAGATGNFGHPMTIANTVDMVGGGTYTFYPTGRYTAVPDASGYTPPMNDIYSFAASPSGNVTTGNTVTITLTMDDVYTVTGVPTITLNSGGTASYFSGSGSNSLVFHYVVGGGDATGALAMTSFNLPGGAKIKDAVGNSASLVAAPAAFVAFSPTVQINGTTASITAVNLSANSYLSPASPGAVIGTLSTTLSSGSFSGSYALSTTGNCNGTNGANNSSFQISGTSLEILSDPGVGTWAVCVAASGTYSNSPFGSAFTVTGNANVATSVSCTATPSGLTSAVPPGSVINTCTVAPSGWTGSAAQTQNSLTISGLSGNTFNLVVPTGGLAAGSYPSNVVSVSP